MSVTKSPAVSTETSKKKKENVLSESEIENGKKRKSVKKKINGYTVKLLLDTGSNISIVNEQILKKIGCLPLRSTKE